MNISKTSFKEHFFSFTFCFVSCLVGVWLQKHLKLESYWASAVLGFVGSFAPPSKFYEQKKIIAAIYTGSFSAMCALPKVSALSSQVVLAMATSFSFIFLSNYFRGVGGKLGTISFIASFFTLLILGVL